MLSSKDHSLFKNEASFSRKDEGPRDFTDPKHNKNFKHLGKDIFP